MWNTDGKPLFKSSKYSVWPLYFVINELPFIDRLKQENMLLAGLWYGKVKPAMHTYLEPFAIALRDLETTGIQVHPPASITPVTLKVILLLGTCDKPAKCMVQNFMQFNGEYGCSRCLNPGKNINIGKAATHMYTLSKPTFLFVHMNTLKNVQNRQRILDKQLMESKVCLGFQHCQPLILYVAQ